MATTVRISALPNDSSPADNNVIPIDNGSTVRKVGLPDLMQSDAAKSSILVNAVGSDYADKSSILPLEIPLERQSIVIAGARYRSVVSEPPHGGKARSAGRWWELDEPVVTTKMFGIVGDGVTDDTAALNAYFSYAGWGSLLGGKGILADALSGKFLVSDTVHIPFGVDLKAPEGSSRYGFAIVADAANWSGADVVVLVQATIEDYTSTALGGLTVLCNNIPGVTGIRGEALYQNSEIKNAYVFGFAIDAVGLEVRPMTRPGTVTVCESVLLENIYAIPAGGGTRQQPSILLDRCQETTLINVKGFGILQGGGGTSNAAAIKFKDCRGITMVGGAAAFAKHGIEIEAAGRNASGFALTGVTYEGIVDQRLYLHGTATRTVSYVTDTSPRLEFPFATLGLKAEYCEHIDISTVFQAADLGLGVSDAIIRGYGTVTADASARYVQLSAPNGALNKYQIRGSAQIVKSSTPSLDFAVDGRAGVWNFRWSASSSVDNGFEFRNPEGNVVLALGTTAVTGTARLAFFGTSPIQKPAVTGAKSGNAALTSLVTALSNLGLITDSTS